MVARLEHPHIVPLYDFWREPGGAYLVFRLLRGGTAEQAMVGTGPFDLARVTRLVEQIGGALGSAHAAGVIHRDVKPANILFDDEGEAYLTDFGIATAAVANDASPGASPRLVRPAVSWLADVCESRAGTRRVGRCPGGSVRARRDHLGVVDRPTSVRRCDCCRGDQGQARIAVGARQAAAPGRSRSSRGGVDASFGSASG